MVFYPDNEKRATRLQQLVDSMANMQTDVKHIGEQMDEKNEQYRPAINALLTANGMDSVDDVINKAASKMSPDERKAFEALIRTIKDMKTGFNATYFVAGLLMAPEGVILTGKMMLAIARWGSRLGNVVAMANFYRVIEGATGAAAAAANEIVSEAEEAEKALEEVGEAGEEVTKALTWMGRLGNFFKVLGAVGFVVTLVAGVIELVQGAEQKKKLIEAIHGLQPTRLMTAFFKQEGTIIMQQLETLKLYLDTSAGGSDPDPEFAAYLGKKIIDAIAEENDAIDLNKLESDLETQDRTSGLFYGEDDLGHNEVVAIASKTK
ncbi:hypothetical protein LXA43DRAFT_1094580 [Ganoderma leucocontextum]|nr:hypothetical protein LXA43DRAFT_1094580 [Ganoderma leucocontextum]